MQGSGRRGVRRWFQSCGSSMLVLRKGNTEWEELTSWSGSPSKRDIPGCTHKV